jgi:hypothetical protein
LELSLLRRPVVELAFPMFPSAFAKPV